MSAPDVGCSCVRDPQAMYSHLIQLVHTQLLWLVIKYVFTTIHVYLHWVTHDTLLPVPALCRMGTCAVAPAYRSCTPCTCGIGCLATQWNRWHWEAYCVTQCSVIFLTAHSAAPNSWLGGRISRLWVIRVGAGGVMGQQRHIQSANWNVCQETFIQLMDAKIGFTMHKFCVPTSLVDTVYTVCSPSHKGPTPSHLAPTPPNVAWEPELGIKPMFLQ